MRGCDNNNNSILSIFEWNFMSCQWAQYWWPIDYMSHNARGVNCKALPGADVFDSYSKMGCRSGSDWPESNPVRESRAHIHTTFNSSDVFLPARPHVFTGQRHGDEWAREGAESRVSTGQWTWCWADQRAGKSGEVSLCKHVALPKRHQKARRLLRIHSLLLHLLMLTVWYNYGDINKQMLVYFEQ